MGFGAKATGESGVTVSFWHTAPDYSETRELFTRVGKLKAQIELLEIEIAEQEREIKRGSRKSDIADDAKEASKDKRLQLARVKAALHEAEYDLKFCEYRKEIFKAVSFNTK